MIREYLFRGKHIDTKEWVKGSGINTQYDVYGNRHVYIGVTISSDMYPMMSNIEWFEVIPETVGQCVGLPDKNETLIFEDDIVKQEYSKTINVMYDPDTLGYLDSESIEGYHIGVVRRLSHYGACMRNPISHNSTEGTERRINRIVNLAGYRCEVIGNIHDDSQLLEVHNA